MKICIENQTIIQNDCLEELRWIDDASIDVVISSPPYNLNIKYNTYKDNLEYQEYLNWLLTISKEIRRVLKNDGSFFLNVGSTCLRPLLGPEIGLKLLETPFYIQNAIIWAKSISIGDTSHGHFKPVNSDRFLNHLYEHIFHFTKNNEVKVDRLAVGTPYTHKSNINRWKHGDKEGKPDCRCRGNIWYLPYKTVTSAKLHPAGFPVELPENCIKLHGIKDNMTVLDPFLGAGTTLIACQNLGVKGIGIEMDEEYCKISRDRLYEIIKQREKDLSLGE